MTREHFDALPQGLSRWQLTLCLAILGAAYLALSYMDLRDQARAECHAKGLVYSDSLGQCLKELPNADRNQR